MKPFALNGDDEPKVALPKPSVLLAAMKQWSYEYHRHLPPATWTGAAMSERLTTHQPLVLSTFTGGAS